MAVFAVGDIHGKYDCLRRLLDVIHFDPSQDEIWCVGDLINRGKQSLEVLRFCYSLGEKFTMTLGNHDTILISAYFSDSLAREHTRIVQKILQASDIDTLITWFTKQPFIHFNEKLNSVLVHAGLPYKWDIQQLLTITEPLHQLFKDFEQLKPFITEHLLGNKPYSLEHAKDPYASYRYLINCFTRMRYCKANGEPRFKEKMAPPIPKRFPWYEVKKHRIIGKQHVIFGHWATLANYKIKVPGVYNIDTACAWDGALTALCIDGCEYRKYQNFQRISISCHT